MQLITGQVTHGSASSCMIVVSLAAVASTKLYRGSCASSLDQSLNLAVINQALA